MDHNIELSPGGEQFTAQADETILDAALRNGVLLPYGCRNGACGSCKGKVTSGQIRYATDEPRALTEREVAAGWTLLCQAHAESALTVAAEPINREGVEVRTLPVRVLKKERLAHDVMALSLQLPPTERLQYLAGQYIDIVLRDGRRRAFSLANAPHDDAALTLHIRHVPDGSFSGRVFGELKERALLRINGPLGAFYLREDSDRPAILVAGGTGFAPINAMVSNAIHEKSVRDLHVYWGVRSKRDLYFHDVASAWHGQNAHVHYVPVLSEPDADDAWTGRTGFVHNAVLEDFPDLTGYDIYASGPPVMVNAIRNDFPDAGALIEHIYSDAFDYAHETGHDS
ncbi:MAG: CDP-6-deoxy-delta-3,4-glucoseen reductase [Gammaproteobacteria bacterium]|nr:CDP-6-deoxy-delta-3,4-glucoseen reductase [Gammaproteobacteria bacterium]